MWRPFGPTIASASASSSSVNASMPICCTNANSPFLIASDASIIGSASCCIANDSP